MASFGTHSLMAFCHIAYASGYYKKITLTIDATFKKAISFDIAQKNTESDTFVQTLVNLQQQYHRKIQYKEYR